MAVRTGIARGRAATQLKASHSFNAIRYSPLPPAFSQVLILKPDKVICFDTLLQVLILKVFMLHQNCAQRIITEGRRDWICH